MKKIGMLVLVLVLALGSMGTAFALWQDVLFLDATVGTGNIELIWTQGEPSAIGDDKDVSTYGCVIVDDTLSITIGNAYPCVDYVFPIDLHCTGTIPVHTSFTMTAGNIDPLWITLPAWDGLQVHPAQDLMGEVVIHLDNTADQGATYTVTYDLVYWQYNEPGP